MYIMQNKKLALADVGDVYRKQQQIYW